jgi:hypothetical protein
MLILPKYKYGDYNQSYVYALYVEKSGRFEVMLLYFVIAPFIIVVSNTLNADHNLTPLDSNQFIFKS